MSWRRLADLVQAHPRRVLGFALAVLIAPTLALPQTRVTYDLLSELPPEAESVKGFDTLARNFPVGQVQPLILVVESDRPLWNDDDFDALDDLTVNLSKLATVTAVRSMTRPSAGGSTRARSRRPAWAGWPTSPSELDRGTRGLRRAIDGLKLIRGGLREIDARLPELSGGIEEALEGIAALRQGVGRSATGSTRPATGSRSWPTRSATPRRTSWSGLAGPQGLDGGEDRPRLPGPGRAGRYGAGAGQRPLPGSDGRGAAGADRERGAVQPGEPVAEGYDGLSASLREVATGLGRAIEGLEPGRRRAGRAGRGVRVGAAGDRRAARRRGPMVGGLDLIIPGLGRLHRGLVAGFAQAEEAGLLSERRARGGLRPVGGAGERVPEAQGAAEVLRRRRREGDPAVHHARPGAL